MSRKPPYAPGLQRRVRNDGGVAYYWIAAKISRAAKDYPTKAVRLHYDTDEERAARCQMLTAELKTWLADSGRDGRARFDGTLRSLADCYQTDAESPYHMVKYNTRQQYDESIKVLLSGAGEAFLSDLSGRDFRRWHRELKRPAEPDGPERLTRAHQAMKMLRILVKYGATERHAGCSDLVIILDNMEFEAPSSRKVAMSYEQAEAIVDKAIELGRPSVALAQAIQYETTLRQKDVIGEWMPADRGSGGIVTRGKRWSTRRRWTSGITWTDIDKDLILSKVTTKTAGEGEWDLTLRPLVMKALAAFEPLGGRTGPVIIDEGSGLPYSHRHFYRCWREIADAAGVPRNVWNMDSRAGGISEGDAAGANVEDLRKHATHSQAQTTRIYMRGSLASTSRVAKKRVALRTRGTP